MKFHNAGKYDGDESKLPQREHEKNMVPFNEPGMKQLAIIANLGSVGVMIVLAIPFVLLGRPYMEDGSIYMSIGAILSLFSLLPHEFLHALCFKDDVYMYSNLSQGMMFVVGTEDMSKGKFIFMSLLPNIVFGMIPFAVFLLFPYLVGCGVFGLICIGMGFGDYINVFNAMTQMPRGAKTYLCGMHSYWYLPEK